MSRRRGIMQILFIACWVLLAMPGTAAAEGLDTGDTAWILTSSALVMLMLPGLALFYAGMVRRKSVLGTMMHSMVALGVITVQWIVVGYTLSFGEDVGLLIGNLDHLFLNGITFESLSGTIPLYVFIMFQGMFAIITPALISGAFAERVKLSTYIVFIAVWATLVYDPICHWVWGGGWMGDAYLGALDFAGGTVVHISSGASALAAVLVLGKRKGYPSVEMIPHNLTYTLLGAGLLWFGWFGFNAGSALTAGTSAGLAFTVTHIAAATGALGWMLAERLHSGKASALGAASGIVAGLVGITPASGFVEPAWAMVIGFGAGIICFRGVLLKDKFGYDDSLDAFGVHGIGGAWGAIATGIFATVGGTGLLFGGTDQFIAQVVSVVVTAVYAFVVTWILVKVLDATMGFRVNENDEVLGLDHSQHGEVGYNLVN
jgi:ammonium transporter, Amt family